MTAFFAIFGLSISWCNVQSESFCNKAIMIGVTFPTETLVIGIGLVFLFKDEFDYGDKSIKSGEFEVFGLSEI